MDRTLREAIKFQMDVYKQMMRKNKIDEQHYSELMQSEEWAGISMAIARARAITFETVIRDLDKILLECKKEGDEQK